MATTRDYVQYLTRQLDISPATSQEELQAAEAICQLMDAHGVEARIQEFDAPAWGGLQHRAVMVVLFVGILLSGIQGTPVAIVGALVVLVCFALSLARFLGTDLISNLGPRVRSQNVVAVHRADGSLADKSNRPIVVVAHYDTPRDNFLYLPQTARFLPLLGRLLPPLVLAGALCGVLQLLVFLPDTLRRIVWIVGIIVALPLLLFGVAPIYERFAPCTDGANDNKASLAAMLGVLSAIRPGSDAADGWATGEPGGDAASEGDVPQAPEVADEEYAVVYEEVVGVRHGKRTLEELRILPEGCEIVYREPKAVRRVAGRPAPQAEGTLEQDDEFATNDLAARGASAVSAVTERGKQLFGRLSNRFGRGKDGRQEEGSAAAAPASMDVAHASGASSDGQVPQAPVSDPAQAGGTGGVAAFGTIGPDDSGLGVVGDVYAPTASRIPQMPTEPAESGATAGTDGGFARRAMLFDLPDPSEKSNDPFATNPHGIPVAGTPQLAVAGDDPEAETTTPLNTPTAPAPVHVTGELPLLHPLDNDWKGGAARRSGLRVVDGGDGDDHHEELRESMREAVLRLGDDALVAHDVWFVALGASAHGHAGMRAFLDEYRKQIRGAFVINLCCVGSGNHTLLVREGIDNPRRADRRMERLIATTAEDLHMPLEKDILDWDTTDATVAMRSSVRAMTIAGMSEDGVFALSHTADDVAENIDAGAVVAVADLVCEVIRRS